MKDKPLSSIYDSLLQKYGPQHWWPGETPFEVCIGAILTQNTAWTNVEKAITNLKQAGVLSAEKLRAIDSRKLSQLIHPSGYYNAKSRKLKAFVGWLGEQCGDNLDVLFQTQTGILRNELLDIHGIGEETADSMLLYAGNHPVFVVDAYTKRIFSRIGMVRESASYAEVQQFFMENLPSEPGLFNEYHALVVRHGKETCRKKPLCENCCLSSLCYYRT